MTAAAEVVRPWPPPWPAAGNATQGLRFTLYFRSRLFAPPRRGGERRGAAAALSVRHKVDPRDPRSHRSRRRLRRDAAVDVGAIGCRYSSGAIQWSRLHP